MLRKATVVLAVFLVLGSSGLSAGAFARGAGHAGGRGGDANRLSSDFGGVRADGYGAYGNRASGLRGGFHGYEGRDMWGHWGAYYGPMVANPF